MFEDQKNGDDVYKIIKDTFDCILVINLEDRHDRRIEMESELQKIGLSFSDGSAKILVASRFTVPGGFETIGARGCFDSHVKAIKFAIKNKAKNLLIFEDDCDFVKSIEKYFVDSINCLRDKDWALFYGGHLSKIGRLDNSEKIYRISPEIGLQGSHFIGVSGHILPFLEVYLERIAAREPGSPLGGPMHVDGAYSWFRREHPHFETWVAEPQLGFQRPSRTDVHSLNFFDRVRGFRELAGLARRFKRKIKA